MKKGPNGRNCCRWCGEETKPPRRVICGPECEHEILLRSRNSVLRKEVFKRDKGICTLCGKDTEAFRKELKILKKTNRKEWERICQEYNIPNVRRDGSLWDCDHYPIPVSEGGGCCGLENVRTLCIKCHLGHTKEQNQLKNSKPKRKRKKKK